ncbi:MAG: sigma-54-dependent Fis family transcriptional regulator, partial [Deltaproteobacteria bacterium]|nr:sigma-54-dependent Fis family transcriptional regulator [Deltaproteobacteria bacterium]
YRLNVIEVRLPPLRQRREDIPMLVEHFLRRFGAEHGRTFRISTDALRRLEAQDYPGNVRELENIIERAVALSNGPIIDAELLPELKAGPRDVVELPATFPAEGVDLERLVADFERVWVQRALETTHGVRKHAATLLGISFRSLRYRLVKLGIDKDDDADDPAADPK